MKIRKIESLNLVAHVVLALLSAASILPFLLLFISSLTDEAVILKNGYSFFPEKFSLEAYEYLFQQSSLILNGYKITILMTVLGTLLSLIFTIFLAYPLSRKELPFRNVFSFLVFFTLLFNGGLVPTYLMYTQIFHIKNTIWALLVPGLLMNGYNVIFARTYFQTNIPDAVIEAANIDGAGKFKTFRLIVFPLSFPIMATVGLFQAIAYWNDWYNGLIYLTNPKLFSLQNILNRMMTDIQFLASTNLGANSGSATAGIPTTGMRMAIAVIGVVPIIAVYPFFQKYFIKGITIGAVKG
ncbi:putative aldouronate transport system permease protein [Anaerobacterium chartisolvens]|uniref:Putative aldouronate transport system permease protein n=1 Tax=Anaerobacterium chartisolvens TaxID=1297424 RepID=A0A369B326_9FIRM|nr:carbohydrate ABC transporter permease [Anaerobacterium chartisolvens]RCX16022.1 putative aldouronate transport system permease protein [Anaerobacterium chartisolvens]